MKLTRLSGSEPIHHLKSTLLDFWRWGFTDLLDPNVFGIFAKYIVGQVIGQTEIPRIGWNHTDFCYQGFNIVVSSDSTIDSESPADWKKKPPLSFDVKSREGRDLVTMEYKTGFIRENTDLYVFCVYHSVENTTEALTNMVNWDFFVVPRFQIYNNHLKDESISLKQLQKLSPKFGITGLKQSIDEAVSDLNIKAFIHIDWDMQDVKTYLYNGTGKHYESIRKESQVSYSDGDDSVESNIPERTLGELRPGEYIIIDQTDTYELDFLIEVMFYPVIKNGEYEKYKVVIPKWGWRYESDKRFNPIFNCDVMEIPLHRYK